MASGPRSVSGRRRSLLKRGTRNSASPTPPCDQPDARAIEITGGPRETLSLQTIGPHVGLRGATDVAALTAAAPLASVPTTTVTVQQARSAIGLSRSRKENDKQLKAILSTVAGGQLRLSRLWRSLCRWRALRSTLRPRRCVDRCRGCHRFTIVDSWMRQKGRRLDPWRATGHDLHTAVLQTHSIPPPRLEPRPCSPSSVFSFFFLSCYT
mgnify:CR=1 FL=1